MKTRNIGVVGFLFVFLLGFGDVVVAGGVDLPGDYYREEMGANHWETSSLREWLNSDEVDVGYTTNPPSEANLGEWAYDEEVGFLNIENFDVDEYDAIAITSRRSWLSNSDVGISDGGWRTPPFTYYKNESVNFSVPEIENSWMDYEYRDVKDRVFLLNPAEAYEYVQKRGYSLKKGLSDEMRFLHTVSAPYTDWHLSGGFDNYNGEWLYGIQADGSVELFESREPSGVVPAMHLKPDYVLDSGKRVSELGVGEYVEFGSYLDTPISWLVINKLEDGHVLLLSKDIISLKPFDSPGDSAQEFSDHVTLTEDYDVEIVSDMKYRNIYGSYDVTSPWIRVGNMDDVWSRRDDEYDVIVLAGDDGSGLKRLILPDGQEVTGGMGVYRAKENGSFIVKAEDNVGNWFYMTLNIGNINKTPTVLIEPSAEGWTNEDVYVDIFASNDVGFEDDLIELQYRQSFDGPEWSDYSSYAGRRLRISGEVEMIEAFEDPQDFDIVVGIGYTGQYMIGNNSYITMKWPFAHTKRLTEIYNNKVAFDFVYTVPNDYFTGLSPFLYKDMEGWRSSEFNVRFTNVKYELLDTESFGIDKIILPDGREIFEKRYVDVLTTDGDYIYRAITSGGSTISKLVSVRIDKVAPGIVITGNPTTWTNDNVTLHVAGSDALSGVRRIQKPNGEWDYIDEIDYLVTRNGSYTFRVEDHAGNVSSRTVVVSMIDKDAPDLGVVWTNEPTYGGNIIVNVSDNLSGVSRTVLSDGGVSLGGSISYYVDQNGTYTFSVYDNAGNSRTESVVVDNILNDPYLFVSYDDVSKSALLNYGIDDFGQDYRYRIYRSTGGGSYVNMGTSLFTSVKNVSVSDSSVVDIRKPSSVVISDVSFVDGGSRVRFNHTSGTDYGTRYDYYVTAEGADSGYITYSGGGNVTVRSGIAGYSYLISNSSDDVPDNVVDSVGLTYEMPVGVDGEFYVHVVSVDNEGNRSDVSSFFVEDDVEPTLSVAADTTDWVSGNVSLRAVATDSGTGVRRIRVVGQPWVDGSVLEHVAVSNGLVEFEAEDFVGNVGKVSYDVSNIDRVAPGHVVIGSLYGGDWSNRDSELFTLSDTGDNASGVDRIEYRLIGDVVGNWTTYVVPVRVSREGVTRIEARVFDRAGNVSSVRDGVSRLDRGLPIVRDVEIDKDLVIDADDVLSGLTELPYRVRYEEVGGSYGVVESDWVSDFSLENLRSNTRYDFELDVRDRAGNLLTMSVGSVVTPPSFYYIGKDGEDESNNFRFDLNDSVYVDGEMFVEVSRNGHVLSRIYSGKEFEDYGLDFEKDYIYSIRSVAVVNGNRIESDNVIYTYRTGLLEAELGLSGNVFYSTTFFDTAYVYGTVLKRSGGDVKIEVVYDGGSVDGMLALEPLASVPFRLAVVGGVESKADLIVTSMLGGFSRSREIEIKKKDVSVKRIDDDMKINFYGLY